MDALPDDIASLRAALALAEARADAAEAEATRARAMASNEVDPVSRTVWRLE